MPFDGNHCFSWGGKRLRAGRTSDALTLRQANAVIDAAYRAMRHGQPFNRHVTIHWQAAGVDDAHAAKATGDLIKLASDWLRTKGIARAWAWVRENDYGDGSKGSHVHILLHCPKAVPIGRMWRRWLRKITGRPYRKGVLHTSRIGGVLNSHDTSLDHYQTNLNTVLAYVVKGVSQAHAAKMGLPRQEAGGRIIGKRAGWSQNIGTKARVLFAETIAPEAVRDRKIH